MDPMTSPSPRLLHQKIPQVSKEGLSGGSSVCRPKEWGPQSALAEFFCWGGAYLPLQLIFLLHLNCIRERKEICESSPPPFKTYPSPFNIHPFRNILHPSSFSLIEEVAGWQPFLSYYISAFIKHRIFKIPMSSTQNNKSAIIWGRHTHFRNQYFWAQVWWKQNMICPFF
jgi:hypothetical protein